MDSAHRVRAVLSHLVSVVSFSLGEPARAQIVLEESTIGIFGRLQRTYSGNMCIVAYRAMKTNICTVV